MAELIKVAVGQSSVSGSTSERSGGSSKRKRWKLDNLDSPDIDGNDDYQLSQTAICDWLAKMA